MERLDGEDKERLEEVEIVVGLGEVKFTQKDEVDGGLDFRHEGVE